MWAYVTFVLVRLTSCDQLVVTRHVYVLVKGHESPIS